MKKIRNSNFEILRILSMFMIICFHCSFHGKFSDGEGNRLIINFFNMFGELGVNCFVLISGYFYDKTRFKTDKFDYSRAAEPPVRCGESHLSGLTEPPSLSIF